MECSFLQDWAPMAPMAANRHRAGIGQGRAPLAGQCRCLSALPGVGVVSRTRSPEHLVCVLPVLPGDEGVDGYQSVEEL
jgi:hypothetical protein